MTDSQFAVFHFDVKTMIMNGDAPMIFDCLADAESHCQSRIAATPAQGCRIYNNEGAIVRTFSDDRLFEKHHGRPAAKRVYHSIASSVTKPSSVARQGTMAGTQVRWRRERLPAFRGENRRERAASSIVGIRPCVGSKWMR